MSAPTTSTPAPRSADPSVAFRELFRLFISGQLTRLRALALLALSSLSLLFAFLARNEPNPLESAANGIVNFGLTIALPVTAVWVATSLVSDLVEDRLLAYLWLKPIPRWVLPAAATAATAAIVLPLSGVPLTVAAAISGDSGLILATVIACVAGAFAYGALLVMFSLRFSRGLWWGLAFVIIWEGVAAGLSDGMARASIRSYLTSIVRHFTEVEVAVSNRGGVAIVIALVGVVVASLVLATRIMGARDVD